MLQGEFYCNHANPLRAVEDVFMHNIPCLNIVHVSYSIFNSELKPNANKDPWRPIPPPESLVLVRIFTFSLLLILLFSSVQIRHLWRPLFRYSLHYSIIQRQVSKYASQQQDSQAEEVWGVAEEPKEGVEQPSVDGCPNSCKDLCRGKLKQGGGNTTPEGLVIYLGIVETCPLVVRSGTAPQSVQQESSLPCNVPSSYQQWLFGRHQGNLLLSIRAIENMVWQGLLHRQTLSSLHLPTHTQ